MMTSLTDVQDQLVDVRDFIRCADMAADARDVERCISDPIRVVLSVALEKLREVEETLEKVRVSTYPAASK